MKIATWNVERPNKASKRNKDIIDCLIKVDADILILTETNELIQWDNTYEYYYSADLIETFYKQGEKRVSIYSKYPCIEQFETCRSDTSICINFNTPFGPLAVYGTIIGINGNRRKNFTIGLDAQIIDFFKIASANSLCISGDFNISFSDNYYFAEDGRQKLNNAFETLGLINVTADIPQNIDHIILPNKIVEQTNSKVETWNMDKKLSDHIGVSVILVNK